MAEPINVSPASPDQVKGAKLAKVIVTIILLIFAAAALGSLWIYQRVKNKVGPDIRQATKLVQEIENYPDAYKQAGLPQYPHAHVTSLSGKDASVDKAISVLLSTDDSSQTVADYFDRELKARSWKASSNSVTLKQNDDRFFYRSYRKADQQFDVTAQTSTKDNKTTITINWHLAD